MHSSPSDDEGSEALFPSANDPLRAQIAQAALAHDPINRGIPELSPPTSQDPSNPIASGSQDNLIGEMMDYTPTSPSHDAVVESGSRQMARASPGRGSEAEHEPGSTWNNKKAKDEYHKAAEVVWDQDFNLRKEIPK